MNFDVTTVINTKSSKAYCTASGGCDEYISRVIFNTIDNTTGCDGYGDYTAISTTVNAGDTYDLTIENGNVLYMLMTWVFGWTGTRMKILMMRRKCGL